MSFFPINTGKDLEMGTFHRPSISMPAFILRQSVLRCPVFAQTDIATLFDGIATTGGHSVDRDGRGNQHKPVASGVYPFRLKTAGIEKTVRMPPANSPDQAACLFIR